jgi:hypothetical protein
MSKGTLHHIGSSCALKGYCSAMNWRKSPVGACVVEHCSRLLAMEALMLRMIKRALLWTSAALGCAAISFGALISWPDRLFAYALQEGKIIVASDRPIPATGGERFLHDCERLIERSPLKAEGNEYRLYVTNAEWRHRLFFLLAPNAWGVVYSFPFGRRAFLSGADFATGRVVHWGYIGTAPRTLAYLCAHELTHIIAGEHLGFRRFLVPQWAWEGLADYVGIENRQSFEELRDALGERAVDVPMMIKYGSYPRYRLLVTYFIEKKGWTASQLLETRLTMNEAVQVMRGNER